MSQKLFTENEFFTVLEVGVPTSQVVKKYQKILKIGTSFGDCNSTARWTLQIQHLCVILSSEPEIKAYIIFLLSGATAIATAELAEASVLNSCLTSRSLMWVRPLLLTKNIYHCYASKRTFYEILLFSLMQIFIIAIS